MVRDSNAGSRELILDADLDACLPEDELDGEDEILECLLWLCVCVRTGDAYDLEGLDVIDGGTAPFADMSLMVGRDTEDEVLSCLERDSRVSDRVVSVYELRTGVTPRFVALRVKDVALDRSLA